MEEKDYSILKKNLMDDIEKYLFVNSYYHLNGFKKADIHMEISKKIYEFLTNKKIDNVYKLEHYYEIKYIHDNLRDKLIDRLDEVIGFPIYEEIYDYEDLKQKFFKEIIKNIPNFEKVINKIDNQNKIKL